MIDMCHKQSCWNVFDIARGLLNFKKKKRKRGDEWMGLRGRIGVQIHSEWEEGDCGGGDEEDHQSG